MICPKCGKSDKEIRFMEAFCVDCYQYNIRIPAINIEECKKCGKIKFRGEWQLLNKKKFEKYVTSKCRGDFSSVTYDSKKNVLIFTISKNNNEISIEKNFEPKRKISLCPECSRKAAGYFEAIIQLRGNEYEVKKHQRILSDLLRRETFLSKVDEKKEGVDLYVGNSKTALRIINEMKLQTLMTKKLMGMREGKKYYRTTFLIRF